MAAFYAQCDRFDNCPSFLKGKNLLVYDVLDFGLNGKKIKVGTVGDSLTFDRITDTGQKVCFIVNAVGIPDVISRQSIQGERGVFNRASNRA